MAVEDTSGDMNRFMNTLADICADNGIAFLSSVSSFLS